MAVSLVGFYNDVKLMNDLLIYELVNSQITLKEILGPTKSELILMELMTITD